MRRNRRATDYYYAFERLKFSMIPLGAALLMMALGGSGGFGAAVPALFVYLALSVSLLRMLRHEAAVIAQRRFQALNLAGLAGVCLLGLALSTDRVLRALRAGAEWVGRYVLLPIAWAVWKVVEWVLSGVNWLLSKISFGENPVELDLSGMQSMGGDEQIGMTEMEQFAANPALQQALKIVGILALCVAGFFLMRALSKHAQRGAEAERREERERLDEPRSRMERAQAVLEVPAARRGPRRFAERTAEFPAGAGAGQGEGIRFRRDGGAARGLRPRALRRGRGRAERPTGQGGAGEAEVTRRGRWRCA